MNNVYKGLIVAVGIKKGGTGKTTTVMNIAPEICPDIIYDTDETPAVSTINQFRPEDKRWNVKRLQASSKDAVNQFIEELIDAKNTNKSVLIDCGGFDSAFTRAAIAAADIIISPVLDDITDILGLQKFDEVLAQISSEIGEKKIAYVLMNKAHPTRRNFVEFESFVKQHEHLSKLNTVIPTDKVIPSMLATGFGVVESPSTLYGRAGSAIRSLFLDLREIAAVKNT